MARASRFRIPAESTGRATATCAKCGCRPAGVHSAILLIGGDKICESDFYARLIPVADRLYDAHLAEIAAEGTGERNDGG